MQNLGIKVDEKEFANLAGKKTVEVINILSEKYSITDTQNFFNNIMEIASNIYKKELTIIKGAYDFVSNQKNNLFIGSNSMKDRIIDGLQRVGLNKYFKEKQIYSFDMVDKPKPDPDIYLKAIQDNNLIVVNATNLCEGLITRIRKTILNTEKSILDYFIVCRDMFKKIERMKIDEERFYTLTKYSTTKGKKSKNINEKFRN